MMHQRIGNQSDAQAIPACFHAATLPRNERPSARDARALPAAWWILPFVVAGATIWIGGIAYGIQMIMGA